jgi:hypothetical protein
VARRDSGLKQTRPRARIASSHFAANTVSVSDPVIEREEVVALLFSINDIAATLERIEQLIGEDDGEEEEADGG